MIEQELEDLAARDERRAGDLHGERRMFGHGLDACSGGSRHLRGHVRNPGSRALGRADAQQRYGEEDGARGASQPHDASIMAQGRWGLDAPREAPLRSGHPETRSLEG